MAYISQLPQIIYNSKRVTPFIPTFDQMSNSLSPDRLYELHVAMSLTHFVLATCFSVVQSNPSFAPTFNINNSYTLFTQYILLSECAYSKVEFDLALHINKLNQRNVARNVIGMQKTIRNDVSHIKFEQTVQKLYTQDICGGHLWIFAFCAFPANYLQGCLPRLCYGVYIYIESR